MTRRHTYFLSDFHLGARYFKQPSEVERRVVSFLDSIKTDAKEIYLMGDILDYWFEYRYVVPRGFTRFFGKLAELTDSGIKVFWFIGNHDIWIFDYLPNELGVEIIDGSRIKEIAGKRFFLNHGDGVGRRKASFKMLRTFFRNRFCQKLYSSIHPRWTIPFALNWSNSSRSDDEFPEYKGEDHEELEIFANRYPQEEKIDYFVFGHRHIMLDKILKNGTSKIVILGDWIHFYSYAVFDGENLRLCQYTANDK